MKKTMKLFGLAVMALGLMLTSCGKDGDDGLDGATGLQGEQGVSGINGTNGTDGEYIYLSFRFYVSDFGGESGDSNSISKELFISIGEHETEIISL